MYMERGSTKQDSDPCHSSIPFRDLFASAWQLKNNFEARSKYYQWSCVLVIISRSTYQLFWYPSSTCQRSLQRQLNQITGMLDRDRFKNDPTRNTGVKGSGAVFSLRSQIYECRSVNKSTMQSREVSTRSFLVGGGSDTLKESLTWSL